MQSISKCSESALRRMCLLASFALVWPLIGCEQKKKVLDIKAPGVDLEINKTEQGVEIESKTKRRTN